MTGRIAPRETVTVTVGTTWNEAVRTRVPVNPIGRNIVYIKDFAPRHLQQVWTTTFLLCSAE